MVHMETIMVFMLSSTMKECVRMPGRITKSKSKRLNVNTISLLGIGTSTEIKKIISEDAKSSWTSAGLVLFIS